MQNAERCSTHSGLILTQLWDAHRSEDQVQDVQNKHIVLVEFGLVGARSKSQEKLEVGEVVHLEDESRLKGSDSRSSNVQRLGSLVDWQTPPFRQ